MIQLIGYNYSQNGIDSSVTRGSLDFITDDPSILKDISINGFTDLFPGNAIVKCKHCGQWGARRCECKKCGAAID